MFKKIISLSLIALMLFSFISNIDATTLTVHARTQSNDHDYGIMKFYNTKGKILSEHWISKGDTRTFDLKDVSYVIFNSPGKKDKFEGSLNYIEYYTQKFPNGDISVDVNFYKTSGYYITMFIGFPTYTRTVSSDPWTFNPAWHALCKDYWYNCGQGKIWTNAAVGNVDGWYGYNSYS